ncbi:MAG TPA: tetratricopeptide repeat protein [Flavobacteriales bacterium]|nr:tetratricopeptide repeat protein [Flavobacteriales bacterium]HRP82063.1 tetratricopeptide repeat protein [Flavobacteriales bacterium]HRQ85671.1 tetratricopeptide repeat protein [Flavobacteriales bacterium]
MSLQRRHWMMIAAAVVVVVLLALAPRTPGGQAEKNAAQAQQSEQAEPQREGPVSSDPKVSAILGELASGGPPMQVIVKLRDLADAEPENVEAQYHMGLFSWQTNQYDKAMERFRKVIELDPKGHPDAYAYLGQAYATLDSTDKAIAVLETYKTLVADTALVNGAERYIQDLRNKQQH